MDDRYRLMKKSSLSFVVATAAICLPATALMASTAHAQSAYSLRPPTAEESQESDWRVIAARCGTPLFEKGFLKQSKAMVAAGLVSSHRDPIEVEKKISNLRRNPLQLIATSADCPAKLAELRELQAQRAKQVRSGRRSAN
ncbi:conserved exported hypothetical protein [Burkholderiales bacterium 8X]|nr:conserved exported hypothetical protein [Burkholderiales bacterium 8X]